MKREELSQAELLVFQVPIAAIEIAEDRLRALKLLQAVAIGKAIAADRQYDPISVAQLPGQDGFTLVDGLHRLVGMRGEGATTIDARIVASDKASRRRQEIASAWARADEDVFDRAAQIASLVETSRDEDPVQCIALGLNWDEATAEALNISRRSVFNYLKMHRFFLPENKRVLRGKGLASDLVPLMRLAALPPYDFTRAFAAIEAGEVATIAEALALVAVPGLELKWEKASRSIVSKVADWPSMYRKRLLETLLKTYDRNGNPLERDA